MSLRLWIFGAIIVLLGFGMAYGKGMLGTSGDGSFLVTLPTTPPAARSAHGAGGGTMSLLGTPSCAASVATNAPFACQLTTSLTGNVSWELTGTIPQGMTIQKKSGWIKWTPLRGDTGSYTINARALNSGGNDPQSFALSVTAGANNPSGIYVSQSGSDGNSGTATAPVKTLNKAAQIVSAGQTIYVRGGTYDKKNANDKEVVKIQTSSVTLRNFGNEYARLVSDRNGVNIGEGVNGVTIEGLEIQGPNVASDEYPTPLTHSIAMANWWVETDSIISGRGITSRGDNITIKDNIVHDFPAGGIVSNDAEIFKVEDNIVYNNAWWGTGGTHGISISSMKETGVGTAQRIKVIGNLAFGNQSLIISHVFSKGFVDLRIDEGSAIHIQNADNLFKKGILLENNLMLFNGKAGINLNSVADPDFSSTYSPITLTNNASYYNDRVVDGEEMILNDSILFSATGNLFHPRASRGTLRDNTGNSFATNSNVTLAGVAGDGSLSAGFMKLAAVFTNPAGLDFTPASGVPSGMGVSPTTLTWMMNKIAEYGIVLVEPAQSVNLVAQRDYIFANWTSSVNTLYPDLVLEVPGGGDYDFANHCAYFGGTPAPPSCP